MCVGKNQTSVHAAALAAPVLPFELCFYAAACGLSAVPPWQQPVCSLKLCRLNTKGLRQDKPQKEVCYVAEADVRGYQVLNLACFRRVTE